MFQKLPLPFQTLSLAFAFGACQLETLPAPQTLSSDVLPVSPETTVTPDSPETPKVPERRISLGLPLLDEAKFVMTGKPVNVFPSHNDPDVFFVYSDVLDWDRDKAGDVLAWITLDPHWNFFDLNLTMRESPELRAKIKSLQDEGARVHWLINRKHTLTLSRALSHKDVFKNGPLPLTLDYTQYLNPPYIERLEISDQGKVALGRAFKDPRGLKSLFEIESCRTFTGLKKSSDENFEPVTRESCVQHEKINEIL